MTKKEAFEELWSIYDYCMMGYDKEMLYKSMTAKEVKERLLEERELEERELEERELA